MPGSPPRPTAVGPGDRHFGPVAMLRRLGAWRQTLVIAHDVAIATMALPIAFMLRESSLVLSGARSAYVLQALPMVALAALLSAWLFGSYRAVWRYMGVPEIIRLGQFAIVAVLLFQVGHFLVDRLHGMPRSLPPLQFLVMMFLMLTSRIAYGELLRRSEAAPTMPPKPILLVGSGDGAALFIQMLGRRRDRDYDVVGILCDSVGRHRSIAGVPILGTLADFDRVLANLRVQDMLPARLVVTRPHHELGRDATYHLMQRAYAHRLPVEQLPDLMRFKSEAPAAVMPASAVRWTDPVHFPEALYPRLKRGSDMLVAALLLAFLSPLLLVAAVTIAVGISGSVMFIQIRPGLHRRPFRLRKFRTMLDPLDADSQRLADADRTPWMGRLLRRSRLDELPQLWNVLVGDMAIIGPRPLLAADLNAMPDHGHARSCTRPGITGWAQVNGGHQLSGEEKLALDLWYIENAGPRLDATIVCRTVAMMLMGEKRNEAAIAIAREALASVGDRAAGRKNWPPAEPAHAAE